MNIENDFLTDFDLFGKIPELYYKGKSKKSSKFGLTLTVIYIILYIAFLIYKLVRMFKRTDVTFYDSYTFQGLPSINLTNNEFYGGFGMGGIVDERMYYLDVTYVSKWKVNGAWETKTTPLQTDICQLDWFGPDYQDLFKNINMKNYYCIKNVAGMVLEGYSNRERFSYFNVKYYPCVGKTKDGRDCYDDLTKMKFFTFNSVELKIQSNDLNPEDYKHPVIRTEVDMNSPVFKDLFQLIYSYLQIINIETDEDITGLNFFTDHIRKQQYIRYENSFLIASPLLYGDIFKTGGPIADVTLQLHAKVLTQKRQYTQLIDVLGDVGGLMEILYSFLNVIASLITEVLYDRSLVNNLFSFDLNKKYVVFKQAKNKKKQKNEDKEMKDIDNEDLVIKKHKYQDLEDNKNIEIYSNENSGEQNIITKNGVSSSTKKEMRIKNTNQKIISRASKTSLVHYNEKNSRNDIPRYDDNKLSIEEDKNIVSINNANDPFEEEKVTYYSTKKDLKNVDINDCLICCFWCTSRKNNLNKILFEEGSKLITEKLDLMNMFINLSALEKMQKQFGIEVKGQNMTNRCKNNIRIYNKNNINVNKHKTSESSE